MNTDLQPILKTVLEVSPSQLESLAPIERVVLLLTLKGQPQHQIAKTLGVSQPTVCYRIKTALGRLQFFSALPVLSQSEIQTIISNSGYTSPTTPTKTVARMIHCLLTTSNQSAAAEKVGRSQGFVRHQSLKLLRYLRSLPPHEAPGLLLTALNMLEEAPHVHSKRIEPKPHVAVPSGVSILREAHKCAATSNPSLLGPQFEYEWDCIQQYLRQNGPTPKTVVLKNLNGESPKIQDALDIAMARSVVFARQKPVRLYLSKPASNYPKDAFLIDWRGAVINFCHIYCKFSSSDLYQHLGLRDGKGVKFRKVVDFVESLGFRLKSNQWTRTSEPPG
jgi:predicted transcriptional regulator